MNLFVSNLDVMEKLSQVPWKWEIEVGGNISDMGGNEVKYREDWSNGYEF